MSTLPLQDNTPHNIGSLSLSPEHRDLLRRYSGVPLSVLKANNPRFLVFPDDFGKYGDNWTNESLFPWISDNTIKTGNVVGFFGIGPVQIQIGSRFDEKKTEASDTRGGRQFFLRYMLRRIMGMYMVDLPAHADEEPIWDFLPYLFTHYLKRAVNQGIFRMYRTFERNDDHVRGAIDIPRHLRINTPFHGTIAYRTREHTGNNALTHLIRHTIEAIRINPRVSGLLTADEDIRTAVRTITELTPDYSRHDLSKVIAKNLRPIRHPYYTEYAGLQTVCLKILRHEKITYGESEDQLSGIVFKAEWLWEEYLASVLKGCGIRHTQNNLGRTPEKLYLYENKKSPVYPDFFSQDHSLVMDAKYKRMENEDTNPSISREDRFQMISYVHILKAESGILIYPSNTISKTFLSYEDGETGKLNGGGNLGFIRFAVPKGATQFSDFCDRIRVSEQELKAIVKNQPHLFNQDPVAQGTAN